MLADTFFAMTHFLIAFTRIFPCSSWRRLLIFSVQIFGRYLNMLGLSCSVSQNRNKLLKTSGADRCPLHKVYMKQQSTNHANFQRTQ